MGLKKEVFSKSLDLKLDKFLLKAHEKSSSDFRVGEKLEKINEHIKRNPDLGKESKGKVLIIDGMIENYILAYAFKLRGYEPIMLSTSSLDYPEDPEGYHKVKKRVDEYRSKKFTTSFHVEREDAEQIEELDIEEAVIDYNYNDINLSKFAISSSRRFLKRYSLNLDEGKDLEIYRKFLQSSLNLAKTTEKIIDENDIKAVLTTEPTYISGVPGEIADENGIEAYSFGFGYRESHLLFGKFGNFSALPMYSNKSFLEKELEEKLSTAEKNKTEEILSGRISGEQTRINHIKNAEKKHDNSKSEYENTFGMFTNLIWDASLTIEETTFNSPLTWIDETISLFKEDFKDSKLIIKTHPAESFRESKQKISEYIQDNHELTKNIEIIEPDTETDPYSLLKNLDAAIVYNSTIGLENSYLGGKTIVAGESHYNGLGFTLNPRNMKEYKEQIRNPEKLRLESTEDLATKYCNILFNRKHINLQFVSQGGRGSRSISKIKYDQIKPGNDNFDLIVSKIIQGEPVCKD